MSSITVSREPSGKYYTSFTTKKEITEPILSQEEIQQQSSNPRIAAIDLGFKTTAKIYSSNKIEDLSSFYKDVNLPKAIKAINAWIKKAQNRLSKNQLRSKNRDKQRVKVAKSHLS